MPDRSTNALSVLRLLSPQRAGTNVTVVWQSVAGLTYTIERSTKVAGPLPIFGPLATDIPGQPGTTTYTDTTALGSGQFFYRGGVP